MVRPETWSMIFIVLMTTTSVQALQDEKTQTYNQELKKQTKRQPSVCSSFCRCSEDPTTQEFIVDCSNRGLKNIPDIPSNVTTLYLKNNKIKNITFQDFKELSELKHLDLSNNKLNQILNNSFFGLKSLKYLSLQQNNLYYSNTTIETDAFNGLDKLEIIHLEGNNPAYNFPTYPDLALSKLTNLREVFMDGCPTQLGPGFGSLHNLEAIILDSNPPEKFCILGAELQDNFFEHINSQKNFSVWFNSCRLIKIPTNIFKSILNLARIDIFNSRLISMENFENNSLWLIGLNISVLNISKINYEVDPYFSHLTRHTFRNLKNIPLKSLDISSNKIYTLDALTFVDLPQTIEYLSLRDNKLVRFEFGIAILTLRRVKIIDVSIQLQYTETSDNTKALDDSNFVCELINAYQLNSSDGENILKNKTAGSNSLEDQPYEVYFPLPVNLEVLVVNTMKIEYSIPAITIKMNKVLKYLDYSNNMARCWQGPFRGLKSLQHLDLSRNYCTKMNLVFFKYLANLTTLLLQDNYLGLTLANDISGIAFSTLTRLETLNISGNTITALSRNVFENNVNLKYLNLSRNSLTHFEVDLNGVLKLEVLDLTGNLLAGFSEPNCKDFKQIKATNPNFKIKIQSNSLMCTCGYLSFVHLLITQPDIFDSVDSITCTTADGSNLSHDQLATFYPQLMKSCVSQEIFIGTLITFFIVLGIVLLSAMFYYNRWKFAYLYFIGSKKLHIGDAFLKYQPLADIYILYEQEPEFSRLARNKFIPWLNDKMFTLINGEDDFPGGSQYENIAGAIAGTRKTLVLLSRDIFEDKFRKFEMNMAIMHEMEYTVNIIVPVFLGHFQVNTWPVEIVTYIRNQKHRCLWYEDTVDFWEELKSYLNNRK